MSFIGSLFENGVLFLSCNKEDSFSSKLIKSEQNEKEEDKVGSARFSFIFKLLK